MKKGSSSGAKFAFKYYFIEFYFFIRKTDAFDK